MNKASERQARYDEKATRRFTMKLNNVTDADVIQKLEQVDSIQGYIKKLVRRDLELEQGKIKYYSIIDMGTAQLDEECSKPVQDIEYNRIVVSMSVKTILDKLEEIGADDNHYSIEEYTGDEEGELIEGSDYDTPSNFIKRH